MIKRAVFLSALALTSFCQEQRNSAAASRKNSIWAGISISQPLFEHADLERLQIYFAVVNDESATVNPNVESSHLIINGVEPETWPFTIANGIRTEQFSTLPVGQSLQFTYALGQYFRMPGIYTVRWESPQFKSADLIFRVMPNS
jgi:hypothetical protein